jgi:hypothetical protein
MPVYVIPRWAWIYSWRYKIKYLFMHTNKHIHTHASLRAHVSSLARHTDCCSQIWVFACCTLHVYVYKVSKNEGIEEKPAQEQVNIWVNGFATANTHDCLSFLVTPPSKDFPHIQIHIHPYRYSGWPCTYSQAFQFCGCGIVKCSPWAAGA